ncbi:hypothetical protein [Methylobacterium sp. WSM2598]|uniref:hypothetical protein n=1 Tax=Methylobacterium sp. WSM2598 TaxID=398261 RepID=UPI000374F693|nr:hypothetical protein [Methylobacterium sp. WSM2598]
MPTPAPAPSSGPLTGPRVLGPGPRVAAPFEARRRAAPARPAGGGVRGIEASCAGLGGRPFAPGAADTVAAEDLAGRAARMRVAAGTDLGALIAREGAALPGGLAGGRVRDAYGAGTACLAQAVT